MSVFLGVYLSFCGNAYTLVAYIFIQTMPNRPYKIRTDHYQYIKDNSLSLSSVVQNALNDVMSGDLDPPEENQRDTFNYEFQRTSISLTPEQNEFVGQADFSFTIFVHKILEDRLERERKLQEIDE